jgi:outer membrane protein, multidrug efflux system
MRLALLSFVLVHLLATCGGPPPYQRPNSQTPSLYRDQQAQLAPPMGALGWWQIFPDLELQKLLRTALVDNFDERIAAQRVLQAQAEYTKVSSARYPQVNAGATTPFTKTAGAPIPNTPNEEFVPSAFISLQYEVDLFGRVRSATAAANAQVLQSEFARQTVTITIVNAVATLYFTLRELDSELAISQAVLAARSAGIILVRQRYADGKGTAQDVEQARELVADVAGRITQLQRDVATTEDGLTLLTGSYPAAIPRGLPLSKQIAMPAVAAAGLPSQLLEQRPDIRASEENLIAANAQIGVARALLFPQLTIGTSIGGGLAQVNGVNYFPQGVFSILPQLVQQVFNAGAARANVTQSESAKEQALLEYFRSIHQAITDVSDALIAYDQNRKYAIQAAAASTAASKALDLAQIRFVSGKTSFVEVLVSETRAYDAQLDDAQAELIERLALVDLYHATGGGWQPEPAPSTK